jgi:hypothetical protein
MRRSKAESTEKTLTKTPAGGNVSKSGGGNGASGDVWANLKAEGESRVSGGADGEGAEQYARHGKGSLSGLRTYISKSVKKTAKTERRRSVRTWDGSQEYSLLGEREKKTDDGDGLPWEKRMSV